MEPEQKSRSRVSRSDASGGRGRRRSMKRHGFVLLEVLLSLTILVIAVSASLRSFSQSLSAVRRLEVGTQAAFFAQQLLDEFEINPPEEGEHEGGFGDDYWQYYYVIDVKYEDPEYEDVNRHDAVGQFFPLRLLKIEIFYDNGRNKPFRPLGEIHTAIIGYERFTRASKRQLRNF